MVMFMASDRDYTTQIRWHTFLPDEMPPSRFLVKIAMRKKFKCIALSNVDLAMTLASVLSGA